MVTGIRAVLTHNVSSRSLRGGTPSRSFCVKLVKRNGLKLSGVSQYHNLASISAIGGPGTCIPRRRSGLLDRAGRFLLIKLHHDSLSYLRAIVTPPLAGVMSA